MLEAWPYQRSRAAPQVRPPPIASSSTRSPRLMRPSLTATSSASGTEAVFQSVGLSRHESAQMVEGMLEEICSALARGESVKLSSFGTFAVRQKAQRMGRNPKTGDEVPIAPRRVLVFRPSHVMKSIINGETPQPEAEE